MEVLQVLYNSLFPATDETETSVTDGGAELRQFGLNGEVSSFYQLNMGLIGIGALAVVAIIGSRNFFPNYLYSKSSPAYDYYNNYSPYDYNQYRRQWDEWYDYWYGNEASSASTQSGTASENNNQYHPYSGASQNAYSHYNGGRKKRSSSSILEDKESEGYFLKALKALDRDGCIQRYVCELAGKKKLSMAEKEVLKIVRFGDRKYDKIKPGKGVKHNAEELKDFKQAFGHGRNRKNCGKLYSKCKYGAGEMGDLIDDFLVPEL